MRLGISSSCPGIQGPGTVPVLVPSCTCVLQDFEEYRIKISTLKGMPNKTMQQKQRGHWFGVDGLALGFSCVLTFYSKLISRKPFPGYLSWPQWGYVSPGKFDVCMSHKVQLWGCEELDHTQSRNERQNLCGNGPMVRNSQGRLCFHAEHKQRRSNVHTRAPAHRVEQGSEGMLTFVQ